MGKPFPPSIVGSPCPSLGLSQIHGNGDGASSHLASRSRLLRQLSSTFVVLELTNEERIRQGTICPCSAWDPELGPPRWGTRAPEGCNATILLCSPCHPPKSTMGMLAFIFLSLSLLNKITQHNQTDLKGLVDDFGTQRQMCHRWPGCSPASPR